MEKYFAGSFERRPREMFLDGTEGFIRRSADPGQAGPCFLAIGRLRKVSAFIEKMLAGEEIIVVHPAEVPNAAMRARPEDEATTEEMQRNR